MVDVRGSGGCCAVGYAMSTFQSLERAVLAAEPELEALEGDEVVARLRGIVCREMEID